MAAHISCRGLFGNFRKLHQIASCQALPLTFCRRRHIYLVQNKCNDANPALNRSNFHCKLLLRGHATTIDPVTGTNRSSDEKVKKDSSQANEEQDKARRSRIKKYIAGGVVVWVTAMSVGVVLSLGKPLEDPEGNPMEDEYSKYNIVFAYIIRTYREIFFQVKVTQEPSRQKLLPDPLTYPYIQPPYTLVIEMTDLLVHPEWTYKTGWRFKKRPGIDYFLRAVGPPTFEVVVFTKESGMTADPIITKIDPESFVMYRLYRDATRYQDGEHIKDLNCLNRDLSRVIMIDWNKEAYKLNPDNGLKVDRWTGEMNDTTLGELAEFLRAIAASKVDDVRPVLRYYGQFEKPLEQFHENQRKLKEEQDRQLQLVQERGQKSLTSVWNRLKR